MIPEKLLSSPIYMAVTPLKFGDGYVIGVEQLMVIFPETKDMRDAHKLELFDNVLKRKGAAQDVAAIVEADNQGRAVAFTLRYHTEIVGYLVYQVGPFIHDAKAIAATEFTTYITPEHRKGTNFSRLMNFAEQTLKNLRVTIITHTNQGPGGGAPNLDKIFKHKGYKPYCTTYVKEL